MGFSKILAVCTMGSLLLLGWLFGTPKPHYTPRPYPSYSSPGAGGPDQSWERWHAENRRRNKSQSGGIPPAQKWSSTPYPQKGE